MSSLVLGVRGLGVGVRVVRFRVGVRVGFRYLVDARLVLDVLGAVCKLES